MMDRRRTIGEQKDRLIEFGGLWKLSAVMHAELHWPTVNTRTGTN